LSDEWPGKCCAAVTTAPATFLAFFVEDKRATLDHKDADKVDHAARSIAYEEAMSRVYLKYPNDREAAVFYALSLLPDERSVSTDNTCDK